MPDTAFATLIDTVRNVSEETPLHIPEDWMQGRTAYGGLIAAMILKSMRRHVPEDRKVRSLMLSFVGPVYSDPFYIQTQVLRSGKSVTTVESKLIQNQMVCSTAVASFGGDRDSEIQIPPAKRIEMADPDTAFQLPYLEGLTPAFTRHFDYRWAIGDLPLSGSGGEEIGGWISFKEATDCLTEEWLMAIADAWPTPVLSRIKAPAAASTVTWALEFVHLDRVTCSQNDWWAFHCIVDSAENGYAHERAMVWDPDAQLALLSHQTTAVFA